MRRCRLRRSCTLGCVPAPVVELLSFSANTHKCTLLGIPAQHAMYTYSEYMQADHRGRRGPHRRVPQPTSISLVLPVVRKQLCETRCEGSTFYGLQNGKTVGHYFVYRRERRFWVQIDDVHIFCSPAIITAVPAFQTRRRKLQEKIVILETCRSCRPVHLS